MRMHKIRFIGLILIVLIFGSSLMVSGQEQEDLVIPMGSFLLEPPESVTAKRSAVDFPHSRHFDFNCMECHHKWDKVSQIDNCTVSGCHDLLESPKKANKKAISEEEAILYYKNAYHKTCIGCHKDIKAQNLLAESRLRVNDKDTVIKKVGPTTCKVCHLPE